MYFLFLSGLLIIRVYFSVMPTTHSVLYLLKDPPTCPQLPAHLFTTHFCTVCNGHWSNNEKFKVFFSNSIQRISYFLAGLQSKGFLFLQICGWNDFFSIFSVLQACYLSLSRRQCFHWPAGDLKALLATKMQMKGWDGNSSCTQYPIMI